MKKLLHVSIFIVTLIALTACGEDQSKSSSVDKTRALKDCGLPGLPSCDKVE